MKIQMNLSNPALSRKFCRLIWTLPLALVLLVGCVPSLSPLLTEKDLVFEEALLGSWGDKDSRWTFAKDGPKSYRVTIREPENDKKPGVFRATLGKLDGHLFMDLYPDDTPMEELGRIDFYRFHYVPAHTFLRVWSIGPKFEFGVLKPDWLENVLKADPEAIRHARVGEDRDVLMITASTPELQKFIIKHANNRDAFTSDSKLDRLN